MPIGRNSVWLAARCAHLWLHARARGVSALIRNSVTTKISAQSSRTIAPKKFYFSFLISIFGRVQRFSSASSPERDHGRKRCPRDCRYLLHDPKNAACFRAARLLHASL